MSTDVFANRDHAPQTTVTSFQLSTPTAEIVGHDYAGKATPLYCCTEVLAFPIT